MTVVVRTPSGIGGITPALREILRQLDAALPMPAIDEIGASRAEVAAGPRFNLSLLERF